MYAKIRNDISQQYYQDNYPNDGQRFVAWYLRNIHNLDPIEAKECVTDGPGDKQIDAVYIDNDSSIVYIIQGKFYSGDTVDATPLREVLASWCEIKNLSKLQECANEKLRVKITELATALEDGYEVVFELITTAGLTESAKAVLAAFQKELSEDDTLPANLDLVDNDMLKSKYDDAFNKNRPYINHEFKVDSGKCMKIEIGGTKAIIAAIPLKECIKIPGIKDGSLFKKNVRQSLGTSNKVNKGIASALKEDAENFFLYHNGITAICSKITLKDGLLNVKQINVVNGCQSLSTIYRCSEAVRNTNDGYVMFRFYEISDPEKADKISTFTNSQSAVKARDLRSNDKYVLAMKKAYEQRYIDGYFITKRGEVADSAKNLNHVVSLTELGKQLIAWHSQRPTISYSETKIFDKYFDQLFHKKSYSPEKVQALNELSKCVSAKWVNDNPLELNESLLAMKAYAPHHHLYTISLFFCEVNKMQEYVPDPAIAYKLLKEKDLLDTIVDMAGQCFNMAFEAASSEAAECGKIFSPQNWIKAKGSLIAIRSAVKTHMNALKTVKGGKEIVEKIKNGLKMAPSDFESRWTAD